MPPSPQFTESSQPNSPSGPDRPENSPNSADGASPENLPKEELSPEKLSLSATEPFPPNLFRVPVPNRVFSEMPDMSDSALRCLLALIHQSFRFDPAESEWVHGGDRFTRMGVEEECGLSSQGTRDGLSELESIGWVQVDRSGRSHQYQLTLKVPAERFTYVPTALLEGASAIDSGTELRVVLAVLRGTWGWTCKETDPQGGSAETVHDRWTQLSNCQLAEATGRSETAVGEAAKALQGRWIERVRRGNGPYRYRFLPEAIGDPLGDGSGEANSFCRPTSNDLTPDRQKSGTPTYSKKSSSKDKQKQPQEKEKPEPASASPSENGRAVPTGNNPEEPPEQQKRKAPNDQREKTPVPNFGDLSPEKRELAEKLQNVGVWAGRIAEILSRFSCARIRANFQLYRQRAPEQTIRKPGAWLYTAITEGYALPNAESDAEGSGSAERAAPNHKEVVSEAKKDAYVAQGISEKQFHRCLSPDRSSPEPQFMYFAPEEGGPERRV
jgi:hypothetical protein